MNCNHPPDSVLCGPLYQQGTLLPLDRRQQNVREQDEHRPQWCSQCGAVRWYAAQPWHPPRNAGPPEVTFVEPRKVEAT